MDQESLYDGLICDNTVQVRMIWFGGAFKPDYFTAQEEFIAQMPPVLENELKAVSADDNDAFYNYLEDDSNFSLIFPNKDVWAAPFVTGYRYNIRWGTGLDVEEMDMHLSDRWEREDNQVVFHSRHIDVREEINFYDMDTGNQIANMTYFEPNAGSGSNFVYNWTSDAFNGFLLPDREFGWLANRRADDITNVLIEGIRCINPDCDLESVEDIPISDVPKYWSNATSWPDGVVPTEGSVEILPGENIVYDLADSPIFEVITVNGRLSFMDDKEYIPKLNLNAEHIFVRAGELLIGSADARYEAEAQITLFGARADE